MDQPLLVQVPLVHHNLHGPDKSVANRHKTIGMFLDAARGGFGTFNELNWSLDKAYLKSEAAKRGLSVIQSGQNGVVYDPKVATAGKTRVRKVMTGGYVGADGVATAKKGDDDRRVGPNRYGVFTPFLIREIALEAEIDVTHLVARAFTVNKWRLPLHRKSVANLRAGIESDNGVIMGDMNDPWQIDIPDLKEVSVNAAATMGKAHYDQVLRWGSQITVSYMRAVNTPSDHHMLVGRITFYRDSKSPAVPVPAKPTVPAKPVVPKPKLPKPGAKGVNWKKYGSPLAHPWAKRSAAFKRSAMGRKIAKWQAAYRRRL